MKDKMAESCNILGGGAFASRLNSLQLQKNYSVRFFASQNSFTTKSIKAFSLAEAMIVILIATIALGMSAPMISRQLKNETLTNTQMQVLQRQIDKLKETQTSIDSGAVMFFRRTSCPTGWSVIKNKGGYYLRIAQVNNEGNVVETKNIGDTLEAMVHKHKHVSPFLAYYGLSMTNQLRYGPYRFEGFTGGYYPGISAVGDYTYPVAPSMSASDTTSVPTNNLDQTAFASYGTGYPGTHSYNIFTYTNDGMNKQEKLFGIKNNGTYGLKNITVCPNRDVGDAICKPSGNNYSIPYLSSMPLVGNENRPKSILLIACEKD